MKSLNRLALLTLLISATLTVMAGSVIGPGLNLMRADLQVDPATAGLILTTHGLFVVLSSPIMGKLIDAKGSKIIMIVGLIVFGISGGAGLLIDSFWPLIVSRAFLGMGVAAFFNAITVTILASYQREDRIKYMGLRGSANSFGSVIWPLLGGTLAGLSWHYPFAVYLLAFPLALLVHLSFPESSAEKTPMERKKVSLGRIVLENKMLIGIYITMFLSNMMLYANVVFVPTILEQIGTANPRVIGLYFAVLGLAAGITGLLYPRIKSERPYVLLVIVAFALWIVSFAITFLFHTALMIAFGLAVFGVGFGIITPTVMVWVGEIGPPTHRGTISSYLGTFGYLGQFLSPIFLAPVVMIGQPKDVFLVGGVICVLFSGVFSVILRRATRQTA
jgi:MFS family permease